MEKNIEFEEMKQQLHQLQQRLDKQIEINERQARRAIEVGMGNLRSHDERNFRLCLIIAFIIPPILYAQGTSLVFMAVTFCILLGNAACRKYLAFDDSRLASQSMIEASQYLLKYKKNEYRAIFLGIPIGLLWCAYYIMHFCDLRGIDSEDLLWFGISCLIGTSIGVLVGLKFFFLPQMRAVDSLLRQIEEVQGEE